MGGISHGDWCWVEAFGSEVCEGLGREAGRDAYNGTGGGHRRHHGARLRRASPHTAPCPAPWQEGMRRASGVPAPADLERLYAVSPIAHVHKVKVGLRIMPLGPF